MWQESEKIYEVPFGGHPATATRDVENFDSEVFQTVAASSLSPKCALAEPKWYTEIAGSSIVINYKKIG